MSLRSSGILTSNSGRRGRVSTQLSQTPRKKTAKDQKMAYFKDVVTGAGVSLKYNDMPNVITQEQSLVTRDINQALRNHITYPNNSQEFMAGLKVLCRNEAHFRKALLPTELQKNPSSPGTSTQPKIQQESLIRMLLNVMSLQNDIVKMILEQVTNCAPEESDDTSWLRLLLNPLRYLSHINDSKALTTKLLDILEIATYTAQMEMLNLIPEIIPDNEYEDSAKSLSKLLEENVELTGAIIDCLNSLNLSSETRAEIQQQILSKLELTASSKIFPILFEFLITDSKNLQTVLLNSRSAIDKIMATESNDQEVEANKVLLFNRLQAFATARKTLCEGWINVISSIRSNTDEKPIDLLILFMLHSVGNTRKSTIEALIRKRVKAGLFKISLVENLFKKYFVTQILKDYLNSIIDIAASLLRFYNEPILVEFSSTIYKMLFNHELIERIQRHDIIYNLLLLTGVSDKKSVTPVLNVLTTLSEDFPKMQQHAVQLMGLLEKLDTIELKDVKLVFDLLCSLTCGEKANDSMSGLKDEIHMVVRKQLSSAKKIIKHRGIIAAVAMAKTLAITSEEQSEIAADDNSMTIDDLPRETAQGAAALLLLANTCTLGSPDSVGLYYDQLASMLATTSNLDNCFMLWLYQLVTNDFQNIFITETVPDPINDIHISMQYSLNTTDEVDSPIGVKIAELCLQSQFFENNSILTLAPLFRLLRLVHFRQHNKDLSSVDALLGCAVLMPKLDDLTIYDSHQMKQVLDCVFHCINWFREVINAFVTQKSRKLRLKVLERLAGVVQLEEILENGLENIPDHKLPLSYFDVVSPTIMSPVKSTKVSRPRKKQKTSDTTVALDETVASTSAVGTQQTKSTTGAKKKPKELTTDRDASFREMDTDVILLLKYPLKVNADIDSSFSQISAMSQTTTVDLTQLKFLLKDLVLKLEMLSKSKNMGLSHMNVVNMTDFIRDCERLLPWIKKHLSTIVLSLNQLLKQTDGCLDAEQMFTVEATNIKITFALILKSYALIFGWSGFQHIKNLNLLRDCLKALREETQSQLMSVKGFIMEFTGRLLSYVDRCLYLPAAVSLVQIIKALYSVNSHDEIKKRIAVVSGKLLTKRWYNLNGGLDAGKNASLNIDFLVKAYLNGASVKTVCGLVGTLQGQVADLKLKEDCLPMLTSINKMNFYIFYRCLCVTLLQAVRDEVTSLTKNQHLVLWRTTALTMQGLMTVVKAQETKTNLLSFLKNSLGILKVFLSSGIPILEITLRSKTDEVVEIFKIMQTSTRFLHHLCCYSKFTKDTSLVAYVPQFRLLLESLLYRVKAALVANGCSEAFWMGTLRNRDLHGEDIISQSSVETGETGSDNEELPPDDSDEEAPAGDEDDAGSGEESSVSEIF